MAIGALSRLLNAPIRRVIFTGGREVGNPALLMRGAKPKYGTAFEMNRKNIADILDNLGLDPLETEIAVGDARGLDTIVRQWADTPERKFTVRTYEANWDKHGKKAGGKRNYRMAMQETPDLVIAFPGGSGTKDMVRIANDLGIPVLNINTDEIAQEILQQGAEAAARRIASKYAPQIAARASVSVTKYPGEDTAWSMSDVILPDRWEASSKAPVSQRLFRGLRDRNNRNSLSDNEAPLSALHMVLSDGNTIEYHYQVFVKGYSSISAGKSKPPLREMSGDELYRQYRGLWERWFDENPDQLELVADAVGNRLINDVYAARTRKRPMGTPNNQARAIADILNLRGARRGVAAVPRSAEPSMTMPMYYKDGYKGLTMRDEFRGKSTLELIKMGRRTSTTRGLSAEQVAALKPGTVVRFKDGDDFVDVVITEAPTIIPRPKNADEFDNAAKAWSEAEGWAPEHFAKQVGRYQIRYKLLGSEGTASPFRKVSPLLSRSHQEMLDRLRAMQATGVLERGYAEQQRDLLYKWVQENKEGMTEEMLEELRPLARWLAAQADESYHALRVYVDELEELASARQSGLSNREAREEFLELQTRFKEFLETLGDLQKSEILRPHVSAAMGRFAQFGKDVGAISKKGARIASPGRALDEKADELLGEVDELPGVEVTTVETPAGAMDKLDKYADWVPDRETVQAAREGIGYNYLGTVNGKDVYELTADDVLQIAARQSEVVDAGAGRLSRTEQQRIDEVNRQVFSDEAFEDRFPDRQSPLGAMVEAMVDQRNSPDSWRVAAEFRQEMERAIRTGNYRIIRSQMMGSNAIPGVDESGKPLKSKMYEVVQKVRDLPARPGETPAYQVFGTEVWHNGRRLNPDEVMRVIGSCPYCGIMYPRGTPGLCVNPSCKGKAILDRVAAKARPEAPESFVQGVLNFVGEGPAVSAARDIVKEMPVRRVVIVADPRYNYDKREIARLIELLDLPYDVKIVTPQRGGAEREIAMAFRNRNLSARAAAERNRRSIQRRIDQGYDETLPDEVFIPDANIETINVVEQVSYTAPSDDRAFDIASGAVKEGAQSRMKYNVGVSKVNEFLQRRMQAAMQARRVTDEAGEVLFDWKSGDTLLLTFGDTADIDALRLWARRQRMRTDGGPVDLIRTIAIGRRESDKILQELRPDNDVLRYIVNNVNPDAAGFISDAFEGLTTSQMLAAQRRIASEFRGYVGQKYGGGSWLASPVEAYRRMIVIERLEKSIVRIGEALANPNLPPRVRASMKRTLNAQKSRLEREYGMGETLGKMFGEGIFPGAPEISRTMSPVETSVADNLLRMLDSGKKLDGSALTRADRASILDFIKDKRDAARRALSRSGTTVDLESVPSARREGIERWLKEGKLSEPDRARLADFIKRVERYL